MNLLVTLTQAAKLSIHTVWVLGRGLIAWRKAQRGKVRLTAYVNEKRIERMRHPERNGYTSDHFCA